MKRIALILLIVLAICLTTVMKPYQAKAELSDTKTLYSTNDAYTDKQNPGSNYGSSADLIADRNDDGSLLKTIALKFDLSSIPANATIHSATLNLYLKSCTGTATNGFTVGQVFNPDWNESSVNWNTSLTYIHWVSATGLCNASTWYHWDVLSLVQYWMGGEPNYGIVAFSPWGSLNRTFASKENGSFKPELVLNYSYPDPAPIITSLGPSAITQTTASIYWATANQMSTSRVDYGTTASYGLSKYSGALVNSHLVALDNLTAGTLYHYKVTSFNGAGISSESADNTFTTESAGAAAPAGQTPATATEGDVNASVPTAAAVSASTAQKTVDQSITAPTLTSVTIGTQTINAPITAPLSVTSGFVVIINGKAGKDAGVALMIGDKAFQGTADKTGAWQIAINSGELAVGDYTVKAQAQDLKKNKGSQIVDLFPLQIAAKPEVAATPTAQPSTPAPVAAKESWWKKLTGKYRLYALAGGIIVLLGLGAGGYFFLRHLQLKKLATDIKQSSIN